VAPTVSGSAQEPKAEQVDVCPAVHQVNKLKLLKRQMYGRANFDLLRQRVLRAA
jgi:hypothetical protein